MNKKEMPELQITDIHADNMTARITMPDEMVSHVKSVLYYAPTAHTTANPALLDRIDAARTAVRNLRKYGDGLMRSVHLDIRVIRDIAVLDDVVTENAKAMSPRDWETLLGPDGIPPANTNANPQISADRARTAVLGLSPYHISKKTLRLLHATANGLGPAAMPVTALATGRHCHGYLLPVSRLLLTDPAVPEDLKACAAYAMGNECSYIRIDSIFETTDDLPTYDEKG